jgi:hypothetical protein
MDQRLAKWLNWNESIQIDVTGLLTAKRTFHEVVDMIQENPLLPKTSEFYGFLGNTYTSHVVMGLRRHLKAGSGQMSLAQLLCEFIESPHLLTRSYFVKLYDGSPAQIFANSDFDKFATAGAAHIDPDLVKLDLQNLKQEALRCEAFADKQVAHRDSKAPKVGPTYNELDKCLELLDELCVKYNLLLRAQGMSTLLPTRQYDWTPVFRTPWIAGS